MTLVEKIVVAGIVVVTAHTGSDFLGAYRGSRDAARDAARDIAGGQPRIMTSGRPQARYEVLLKERYNIELDYIGGCCPNSYQSAYVRGYNKQAQNAVAERLGGVTLDSLREEARQLWMTEHERPVTIVDIPDTNTPK